LLSKQIVSGAAVCPNGSSVHQRRLLGKEQDVTGDFLIFADGRMMENKLNL